MTDETLTGSDEDSVLAAEHALRLLDGPTLAKAEARIRGDSAFAAEVERWQERFAPLFEGIAPVAPPASAWTSLAAQLGGEAANDNVAALEHRLRIWRGMTAGAAALAAVCVAALVLRAPLPPPVPAAPTEAVARSPMQVAALRGENGPAAVVASYDRDTNSLVITPAGMPAMGGRSAELWVIPAGGVPHSLGLLDPAKPTRIALPAGSGVGTAGAALAVSLEPAGGSKTGLPTGPVIASGALVVA